MAVVEALSNVQEAQEFISMAREAYRTRRSVIVDGLNALGLPTPRVNGAFYVLCDVSRIDPDENQAALKLLNQARVAVVPGTDFAAWCSSGSIRETSQSTQKAPGTLGGGGPRAL